MKHSALTLFATLLVLAFSACQHTVMKTREVPVYSVRQVHVDDKEIRTPKPLAQPALPYSFYRSGVLVYQPEINCNQHCSDFKMAFESWMEENQAAIDTKIQERSGSWTSKRLLRPNLLREGQFTDFERFLVVKHIVSDTMALKLPPAHQAICMVSGQMRMGQIAWKAQVVLFNPRSNQFSEEEFFAKTEAELLDDIGLWLFPSNQVRYSVRTEPIYQDERYQSGTQSVAYESEEFDLFGTLLQAGLVTVVVSSGAYLTYKVFLE